MISVTNKTKCCGCTACVNICPKKCIIMKQDNEGFQYPHVDIERCINCRLCDKSCPILNKRKINKELNAVAVQNKEKNTLYHSAAGGAFSAIATVTIENGGVVYGAAYDENMVVRHKLACTIDELNEFRSSKYVQSDLGNVYVDVEKKLQQGKEVCFSGTPCQVAGLKNYLKKEYSSLVTVDLVCKGVGSPEVLRQYVELQEKKYKSTIIGMNFKRKTYGYHSSTMSVDFNNGKSYSCGGITDPMMRSFRANICLRPSCSECSFKGRHRESDLTIFDCWHYSELTGKKDDDRGHTAVLIHSEKGKQRIQQCGELLKVDKINPDEVIELDGIMVEHCVTNHKKRDAYMRILESEGLERAIEECIPITSIDRYKEASKEILYRIGLLSLVKSVGVKRK